MHDRASGWNRAAWWCPPVLMVVMFAAAAMLYRVGYSAIIEHYDGIVSMFNLTIIISWCSATVVLLATLPIGLLIYVALHDR